MTIYVITSGAYSDYHICAATLDKDKAEKLRRFYSTDWYGEAEVEEFEEDNTEVPETRRLYSITISRGGEVSFGRELWTEQEDYKNGFGWRSGDEFYAVVAADDEEHAKKIALDERAKQIAERFGL